MDQKSLISEANKYFMPTYSQFPVVFTKGDGIYLEDIEGKKYLDFVAGISVNIFGYNDQNFKNTLNEVIAKGVLHTSNLYYNQYAIEAAKKLVELSKMDKVFFCNSGTEANEAAIKLVRKYGRLKKEGKTKIVSLVNSFHGRTIGALSATGQPNYQKNFAPMVDQFKYAPINNYEELVKMVDEDTCAIFIEVVQGEGGIVSADKEYLQKVRTLCDKYDILLVCDEIQCGLGRTGKLFGWQKREIECDVMTLAKALGNGIPIGAVVTNNKCSEVLQPGDHGSTFGGNFLATSAANYVLNRLSEPQFMENVEDVSTYLNKKLIELKDKHSQIKELRGEGLMVGLAFEDKVKPIIDEALKDGLLVVSAGANVIRLLPPLIVTKKDIDKVFIILDEVLNRVNLLSNDGQ